MNKKKIGFLSAMAALALVIFTFAAVPAGADPLPGTSWVAILGPMGYSGPSLLEFTTAGNATGTFGVRQNMGFTYTFDTSSTGTLIETITKYDWDFTLGTDPALDRVTMTYADMAPYAEYDVPQTFYQIEFSQPDDPEDLTNTNWLGLAGKMGETLLNNIVYDPGEGTGTLDCTVGPNAPITDLDFSYTYNGSTGGRGTVNTLGPFTTDDSTATMVFSNFMGSGTTVTLSFFTYVPIPVKKPATAASKRN
jgi:hypothetical protein